MSESIGKSHQTIALQGPLDNTYTSAAQLKTNSSHLGLGDISTLDVSRTASSNQFNQKASTQEDEMNLGKKIATDSIHSGVLSEFRSIHELRTLYQIRGWSLLLPIVFYSIKAVLAETISLHFLSFVFVVATCLWVFWNIRCLQPRQNVILVGLVIVSLLISGIDFLSQYDFIGNEGWTSVETYKYCFQESIVDDIHRHQICTGFKMLYYLYGFVYTSCLICFLTLIYTTIRILKLTNFIKNDGTYRIELEEEMEKNDE